MISACKSPPTGGAIGEDEVAAAPLMIQGDQCPVAFRNFRLIPYDAAPPTLDLDYRVHYDSVESPLDGFEGLADRAADKVGETALRMGIRGPGKEYVPDMPEVLYYTRLVEPGQSDTIYLTAPTEPGPYEFVCTYPGHYLLMRGVLRVI